MTRNPRPGRYAAPEPRSYGAGEAAPLPEVSPLPDRLVAAVERAQALLRRAGVPTVATLDLPGGGFRSLTRHVVLLGHPRDGDVHLAARLIVAADDVAAGGERRDHALIELGQIDALGRIYMTDSRIAAKAGRKPKRRAWAEALAERIVRTGEAIPEGDSDPLPIDDDHVAYIEGPHIICADSVTGRLIDKMTVRNFNERYRISAK